MKQYMQEALGKRGRPNYMYVFSAFAVLSILLFWPVLNKSFASDDFSVLYRVVYHPGFFMKEYFRPLSDVTLYFSYLTGGFHPLAYNLFNVLLHAGCCFLLFWFCMLYKPIAVENRLMLALGTGILFLIYPFHIETIVWVVGRASLLSCFLGFFSIVIVFTGLKPSIKYSFSCLFYFLGLCSYETIVPLPAIILILLYKKNVPLKKYSLVAAAYSITFLLNMIIRYKVSGVIYGAYGARMFEFSWMAYIAKIFKAWGRLFLPPSVYPVFLMILFGLLTALIVFILYLARKKGNQHWKSIKLILATLVIACIVPFLFGVNTRTIESDRVLYFPSFFACIFIGWCITVFFEKVNQYIAFIAIGGYFLFFFYQAISIWNTAGKMTENILATVPSLIKKNQRIVFINFPEEYKGAQVLRNGLPFALLINGVDTTGINVVSYSGTGYEPAGVKHSKGTTWFFYPNTIIRSDTIHAKIWPDPNLSDSVHVAISGNDQVYYWYRQSLHLFNDFR